MLLSYPDNYVIQIFGVVVSIFFPYVIWFAPHPTPNPYPHLQHVKVHLPVQYFYHFKLYIKYNW